MRAQVTRVVDGDTVEVRFGGREEDVRLIGVDTPETVKPGTPVQCFGPQASDFSHRQLEGQWVRLVFGVERRDVYGGCSPTPTSMQAWPTPSCCDGDWPGR